MSMYSWVLPEVFLKNVFGCALESVCDGAQQVSLCDQGCAGALYGFPATVFCCTVWILMHHFKMIARECVCLCVCVRERKFGCVSMHSNVKT